MITYKVIKGIENIAFGHTSYKNLPSEPSEFQRFLQLLISPIYIIIAMIVDILFLWVEIPYGLFLKFRGVKVFTEW